VAAEYVIRKPSHHDAKSLRNQEHLTRGLLRLPSAPVTAFVKEGAGQPHGKSGCRLPHVSASRSSNSI
jgi:hypothetical protein